MRALEFIHRFNHAIFRNVIDIATKQRVSVNSLLHRRENGEVLIVEKIAAAKRLLDGPDADVCQRHVPRVFVDRIVDGAMEGTHDAVHAIDQRIVVDFTSSNHERDARLVDQDRIGLVDKGCGKRAVDLIAHIERELVAEVIKADFIRGGIRNIASVGVLARGGAHSLLDATHGEP